VGDRTRRLAVSGLVLFTAAGLVLAGLVAARVTGRLTRPLLDLRRTVGRLADGDLTARAVAGGPAELRELAGAVNALAAETGRLRRTEEKRAVLQVAAREAGVRIREHLEVEALLAEAIAILGSALAADRVLVRLYEDDQLGPVAQDWAAAGVPPLAGDVAELGRAPAGWLRDRYLSGSGPEAGVDGSARAPVPDERELLAAAGAGSWVTVPFGTGTEMLGAVTLLTASAHRAWRPEELSTAESVALDLAHGLVQARQYERERDLVEQLRALDQTKSEFLSTVSHELRTPLTSIAGYLELILDGEAGEVPPEQERMLRAIRHNAGRLRVLIEDLLTLSRIETGAFRTGRIPVDLRDLVLDAAGAVRDQAGAVALELVVECGPGPLAVAGDRNQLARLLSNLLSNAVKFTAPGGWIGLRAEARGDEVVVIVDDTGIGIPREEQEGLFNRFFRASNATEERIQGTGLGLAIAATIVANHHGTLTVASEEGDGTVVTVRLPRLAHGAGVDGPHPGAAAYLDETSTSA
jgi:signal transduction histidine kinase